MKYVFVVVGLSDMKSYLIITQNMKRIKFFNISNSKRGHFQKWLIKLLIVIVSLESNLVF